MSFKTQLECIFCSYMKYQLRFMSTKTKKPAKFTLQATKIVAATKKRTSGVKTSAINGPFGGMNLTRANIRVPSKRHSTRVEIRTKEDPRFTPRNGNKGSHKSERSFKALKMQRSLATISYQQRSLIRNKLQDIESFEDFGLLDIVSKSIYTQGLGGMVDVKPTPVQKIAIPALMGQHSDKKSTTVPNRETFLIAAETGSGKTISYLVPAINAIKLAENEDIEVQEYDKKFKEEKMRQNDTAYFSPPLTNLSHPTTGRPRVIILVPTQELVAQVGAVVKLFGHTVKFRSALISSSLSPTVIRNRIFSPQGIDIIVSMPHLISSIADGHPNILSRVTHLIIDEADSLLDRSFIQATCAIIDRATPSLKKLIMCSATIPLTLDNFLRSKFPETRRLVTPNLHAIPRRVQLEVVNVEGVPFHGRKDLACADLILNIGNAAANLEDSERNLTNIKQILVFVNEREKTLELRDFLLSKGIDAIALNRDTKEERESKIIFDFTKSGSTTMSVDKKKRLLSDEKPTNSIGIKSVAVKRKILNVKTIITTDLNSRGIDMLGVRNVILYDVPHSTIDFIHRLGRTGRMGRRGRGYVLVGKDDRKDVVAEVKSGMYLGKSLI